MQFRISSETRSGLRRRFHDAVWLLALLPAGIFVLIATMFIPYLGIQFDEALFAWPLVRSGTALFTIDIGQFQLPLMLMSYLGALKTWLYYPLMKVILPSALSLRMPAVLLAAMTLMLWFWILTKLHGTRAALIAIAFLVTDSTFVLTSTFDWGPVVLQHLLLAAAVCCVLRFFESAGSVWLWFASFLVGLAVWDKALAVWMVSGLLIAGLAVYPAALFQVARRRAAIIAVLGFVLGAAPLIYYNVKKSLSTVAENAHIDTEFGILKVIQLERTLSGNALYGYMMSPPDAAGMAAQISPAAAAASTIDGVFHSPSKNWFVGIVTVALLGILLPAAMKTRRLALFLIVAFAVAWLEMALVKNTGGSAHHIVLLWPLPHFLVGVVFATIWKSSPRIGVVLATVVLMGVAANAVNLAHYLTAFATRGPSAIWSEATLKLPGLVEPYWTVGVTDWGILAPLDVITGGRHRTIDFPWIPESGDVDAARRDEFIRQVKSAIWVHWTPYADMRLTQYRKLMDFAGSNHLRRMQITEVQNRQGIPLLELFRLVDGDEPLRPWELSAAMKGFRDDRDPGIRFTGRWTRDDQFASALGGTLTYSEQPGAAAEFDFEGSRVTLVFTRAFNRGRATITVDGHEAGVVDLYAPSTRWREAFQINVMRGQHTLRMQATGRSDPHASGVFIDLDGIVVAP